MREAARETQSSASSSYPSSSRDSSEKEIQVPTHGGLKSQTDNIPALPMTYSVLDPGIFHPQQNEELMNRGPGLYAVPVLPYMQTVSGFHPNALIPFTYNIPTERHIPETREMGGEQGQIGEQHQPQAGPQRQGDVRRFQIAIHIDLLLILKLAAVIFFFNQDGSKQRLTLLVIFASFVYLYQTGALAPLVRWLSQGMQREAAPPHPPRAAVRADNVPPAGGGQGNDIFDLAEQPAGENENVPANEGNAAGNRWWGIVKEIQMIVFGFITSLLPGFHNVE